MKLQFCHVSSQLEGEVPKSPARTDNRAQSKAENGRASAVAGIEAVSVWVFTLALRCYRLRTLRRRLTVKSWITRAQGVALAHP